MRGWQLGLVFAFACVPPAARSPGAPAGSPMEAAAPRAPSAGGGETRSAAALRVELPREAGERFAVEDDPERPLVASVYSLPSTLIDSGEAAAMLAAVRAADPRRQLLAVVDVEAERRLAALAGSLALRLLPARGGPYSPWPRDPFSFARAPGGAVRLIVRPNLQRGREADADLGPELVSALPADVDRAWGGVRWARADVPFHNGQLLLTRDAAWATLHTFEPRVLQLLAVERVPVESFGSAAGIDAYLAAATQAAAELGALYGRPVRFVHPLPTAAVGPLEVRRDLMHRIGGGAGFDLDSLVTLLPARGGRPAALVADLELGRRLAQEVPAAEWQGLAAAYDLAVARELPAAVDAAAQPGGRDLASFLDLVAAHLAAQGFDVERLPLWLVPMALVRDSAGMTHSHFLLGWNNVVVETRGGGVRAEGFASLLPSGDRRARATFAALGARLDLLPPLLGSVVRNGGYRCASNHLRAGAPPRASAW